MSADHYLRWVSSHLAEARAILDSSLNADLDAAQAQMLIARAQVYATMAVAAAQAAASFK